MNIGDYARNKYGIAKLIGIEEHYGRKFYKFDKPICYLIDAITKEETNKLVDIVGIDDIDINKLKHSSNIRDLLEIGDIIRYWFKCSLESKGYMTGFTSINDIDDLKNIKESKDKDYKIISVIPKEKIEGMEYKI